MLSASEKLCRVCKKTMPAQGRKCTACNSFQDWWRILSFSTEILALLIAVFSLFGIAVPAFTKWWNRHSHTQVRIIGTSEEDLLVILMNTGHEPSTVRRFRVSFVNVPLDDADLYPVEPVDLHIPAENSHVVRLRPRRLTPMLGNDIAAVTIALRGGTLKLTADINESTDERPIDISRRSDEYPTTDVSAWIKNYIPEV
jgi:hypothetical protein